MRKSFKKTIALILSIVMIMGVIPMGMSFAAETEGYFTYEIVDEEAIVIGYDGPTAVVVPETLGGKPVAKIGDKAPSAPVFNGNTAIVSVVLPDTIEEISSGAFWGCSNLETIDLGSGVKTIGDLAFGGCTKLATVTVGAELTAVDVNAFATNSTLTVNFEGTIAQWNALRAGVEAGNEAFIDSRNIVYCYGMNCTHSNTTVTNTATCTTPGTKTTTCDDCGFEIEEPAAAGHKWNYDAFEDSENKLTCTTGATVIVPCSACDVTTTKWMDALGHKVATDGWEILDDATCTEDGSKIGRCERCGKLTSAVVKALGHDEEITPAKAPTCTETGYTVSKRCKTCNTWTVVAETLPKLDHDYLRNEEDSSDVTCTQPGFDVYVCKDCSAVKYVTTNALGHDKVTVNAKAPDCENGGWNAHEYCTRCNYTTREDIPAKGHRPGAPATCTTAQTCVDCDYVYAIELGHTTDILEGYDPACGRTGLSDGEWCTVCEVILEPQEIIPALSHNYVTTLERVEPTCTTDGRTAEVACENCGRVSFKSEVIPSPGHIRKPIAAVASTCTEAGSTAGVGCENCDEYYFDEPQVVPALGHDIIDLERVEPTCTTTGLTAGKKCNRDGCDYVKTKQKVINKLPHTNVEIPGVEPTCTETGLKAGTECTVCGTVTLEREELPANGHNPVYVPAVAATCTEVGYKAGAQCSVCNVFTLGHEEIPANGHTPSEEATCTEAQVCTICEEELEAALGHDMVVDETVSKDATCLKDGYVKADCSRCDYSYEGVVPATDHNVQNWTDIILPTCKVEGQSVGLCVGCKYDIKKTLPKVDHKDDDKNNQCDYCGNSMGATSDQPSTDDKQEDNNGKCTCLCHAVGIRGLLYDFLLFIQRLFGLNKTCKCGVAHY